MAKFVKIQSTTTITVTAGLTALDVTNENLAIPDRLNVKAAWVGTKIQIVEGVHWYPAEIQYWDSVKALSQDKILTIGEESDFAGNEQDKAEETLKRLEKESAKYEQMQAAAAPKKTATKKTAAKKVEETTEND